MAENEETTFKAAMYEQYGDWTFTSFDGSRERDIVYFAERMKEPDQRHVKWFTVIDVQKSAPKDFPAEGIWVCVFKNKDTWRITQQMKTLRIAQQHALNRLTTEADVKRGISKVSIQRIPYPEGYDGIRD